MIAYQAAFGLNLTIQATGIDLVRAALAQKLCPSYETGCPS